MHGFFHRLFSNRLTGVSRQAVVFLGMVMGRET